MSTFQRAGVTLTPEQSIYLVLQLLQGLDYAHKKTDPQGHPLKIVHCDVSPDNALISYQGEVKLLDFGIARAATGLSNYKEGMLMGKLGYVAPEQASVERAWDHGVDIFAAGILLYELLTKQKPESGSLVPLAKELYLAKAYAEIEVIRLGERLRVEWRCDEAAMDARVPPLILQPLVENAVYHGIEPAPEGGQVLISTTRKGAEVTLMVRNTCTSAENGRSGNRMALDNIRERLDLHFDAEARMSANRTDDEYVVQITLPYKAG